MEIDLVNLRAVTIRLLDHIINTHGIKKTEIGQNLYWTIPSESLFELDAPPTQLDVGSLEDDWEFVSSLLEPNAIPVAWQLTELAPLLSHIGAKLSAELAEKGG